METGILTDCTFRGGYVHGNGAESAFACGLASDHPVSFKLIYGDDEE